MSITDLFPPPDDPFALDLEPEEDEPTKPNPRSKDLLGRKNSKIRKKLDELYDQIHKGFNDQARRSDDQLDWWDCYYCKFTGDAQFYNGNAEIYIPIIRDAINARATRGVNQLFPNSNRYVDVVSADGKQPSEIIALLDHYIRRTKLKTRVARPLWINGDVEGQYNLYVDWNEVTRWIVSRETHGPVINQDGSDIEVEGEEFEDLGEEEIKEGMPCPEVLHDCDVLILPATADSVEDALECGGSVTIVRRWSKSQVEAMIERDDIRDEEGEELLDRMKAQGGTVTDQHDIEKTINEHVGIRSRGASCVAWETWTKLPLSLKGEYKEGESRRLARVYFGANRLQLGCRRNPYWNDRCPLLSEPVKKVAGSAKGQSMVESVAPLQYEANDAANEGADSAHYSAMPLVRVSTNVTQPIILNLGAILKAEKDEIEMMAFPDLTPRALQRIQLATAQIFQTLSVNPSMLPQQTSTSRRNQAQVAQEQQVDILTTAEETSVEEGLLSDLMAWFVDLDHQFRDRELTVRAFGEAGIHAEQVQIPPLQNRHRYEVRWSGVEQARNAAQLQQMFMGLNVFKGLAPELMQEGYRFRIAPLAETAAMSMFGARIGAQCLLDMRHQSTIPPEQENQLLREGHEVYVMPLDNDAEHLKSHMQEAQQNGDPFGNYKLHIAAHMKQMQMKAQAQAQQAMQQMMGQMGAPGGQRPGQQRPGGAAGQQAPRQGAMPAGPRQGVQGPPGMIRPDNMPGSGGIMSPRRF
jgi:hypothetical protein